MVSYAMGITDIDPLAYGLLFERFLNPERVSLPDIDIDFCTRRRGEVIQYVTEKYGREQVAQIITFGTLGARAAIKDCGRVLDLSFADVDRITKLIPNVLNIKLKEALAMEPALSELARKDPRVGEVLEVAQRLEGMARNASMHAAGVVISPVPLRELVPLYRTNKDEIVTAYDMTGLEKLSLLKMDFLGLTTLTIIRDTIELIRKTRGVELDPDDLPLDDPKTYELFSRALTSGVFQFESRGMRELLRRYQPDRIEDLIALNALFRPGPLQGGMTDDFIERKHGRRPVTYDIPALKELLEETYGVVVYQEQVMQIANRIAGYTLGEADVLRRAMGKKKPDEMAAQRERFVQGAVARGYPRRKVEKLFDMMEQFAGYGFNKSHSAAYAYLAYVTAYLKAHYPVEFMAALLTSETGNTAKVVKYIHECREMGIRVLPADVNSSEWSFTPAGEAIRFGLGAIRNTGQAAVEAILEARNEVGRFRSLYQFCEKASLQALNRRMIESLIRAGAMDSLEGNRAQLIAVIDSAMEAGQKIARDREMGQAALFALAAGEHASERPLPNVADWTPADKMKAEKEVTGFYVSGHPLDEYPEIVREVATHTTDNLEGLARGAEVALCGILTSIQRRRNKKGEPWAVLQIEDRLGQVEGVVFASKYAEVASILAEDAPVLVRGTALPEEGGASKVSVQDVVPLHLVKVSRPTLVSIRVPLSRAEQGKVAAALQELFERKRGETAVRFRLERPREFSVIMDVTAKVRADQEFRAGVASICGPEALEILASD